jgi:hypothetical protein
VKSARVEVAWWSARPASPFAEPEAVFRSAHVDLSEGVGTFRVEGNALAGWVALFVEADGRRRLARPFGDPLDHLEPARGYGDRVASTGVVPIVAGASDLRLSVLDREGKPVEGIEVDARAPDTLLGQRAVTPSDGRVVFPGFADERAFVSWRERRRGGAQPIEAFAEEFAQGEERLVTWAGDDDVVLRVARNPWVRIRVRIDGAPEDAWCPVRSVRVQGVGGRGQIDDGSHGFFLPPGMWRGDVYVVGAAAVSFVTPRLALDSQATVEARAVLPPSVPWLEVSFVPRPPEGARVACAIEAKIVNVGSGSWRGFHGAAPHWHLVVPCSEGEYVMTGAIRVDGDVGISNPRRIVLGKGDRPTVLLATSQAGGVVTPPTAPSAWNDRLDVLESAFPSPGVVEDAGFRFGWLGNRVLATTWWMPPGTYTLVRRGEEAELARVTLDVKPGRVLRVLEDDGVLRVAGE